MPFTKQYNFSLKVCSRNILHCLLRLGQAVGICQTSRRPQGSSYKLVKKGNWYESKCVWAETGGPAADSNWSCLQSKKKLYPGKALNQSNVPSSQGRSLRSWWEVFDRHPGQKSSAEVNLPSAKSSGDSGEIFLEEPPASS